MLTCDFRGWRVVIPPPRGSRFPNIRTPFRTSCSARRKDTMVRVQELVEELTKQILETYKDQPRPGGHS
jgi:hypothetical protein